ncbi:uncharacterized protein Hap1MRO34_011067 [Clarias gariepinus]
MMKFVMIREYKGSFNTVSAQLYRKMMNPFILLMTLSCLKEQCLEKNICHEIYGETPTPKLENCVAQICRESVEPCTLRSIPDGRTEKDAVLKDINSLLNCGKKIDEDPTEVITCILEVLLGDTQQHSNDGMSPFMSSIYDFSNYMFCWIKTFLSKMVKNCFSHYDVGTLRTLVEHLTSKKGPEGCFLEVLPYWGKKCIPVFVQLFGDSTASKMTDNWEELDTCATIGINLWQECLRRTSDFHGSNPNIVTHIKDVYVCTVDEMILATASC